MGGIDLVLLAAGQSARFGGPKLLAEVAGRPLLQRQTEALLEAPVVRLLVVVGAFAAPYRACLPADARLGIVENPHWASGLGSSIAAGLRQVAPDARGVVIALADQPALSAGLIAGLVARFDGGERRVVACRYAGVLGPPALFGRGWFDALAGLGGETGARGLLRQATGEGGMAIIDWPDGAIDLDTREDLARWQQRS